MISPEIDTLNCHQYLKRAIKNLKIDTISEETIEKEIWNYACNSYPAAAVKALQEIFDKT